jgi:uncharacterized protein (DUF2249 family)
MTSNTCTTRVDLREFARESRPGLVDQILRGLSPGASTELIDDTDPQPMLLRLGQYLPGQFSWDVSQVDAGQWLARLAKAPAAHGEGRCCGACGGS